VALVLLAANLVSRSLGPLSWEWSRAFAICSLSFLLAANLRFPLRVSSVARVATGGALALGLVVCLGHVDQSAVELVLVFGILRGIATLLGGLNSRLRAERALTAGLLALAVLEVVLASVPRLGELTVTAARAWSHFIGVELVGQPLVSSPAGLGGGVLASLLCYLAAVGLLRWRRPGFSKARWLGCAAALLPANALFLCLQNQPALLPQYARAQFFSQVLFLGLCLLVLAGFRPAQHRRIFADGSATRRKPMAIPASAARTSLQAHRLGALGALFLSILGLATWPGRTPGRPLTAMFYNDGFLDWDRPTYGRYGPFETGMFGSLPDYLGAVGWRSRFQRELSAENLAGADVLVVINPTNRWRAGQLQTIWRYVKDGGSLLVLGDHTDIMGSKVPLDTLLEPVNIRFNFDAGFPARPEWRDCFSTVFHPITARIKYASDTCISVGATLEVGFPSFTVIWGRYGFADLGNQLNVQGAFLGDYQYEKGEQLGDVSLVAVSYYGRGKVLVFGDTSSFQNGALGACYLPFVHHVFTWLTTRDWESWGAVKWALGVTGLLSVAGLIFWWSSWGAATGSVIVAAAVMLGLAIERARFAAPSMKAELALIDRSHDNRISLAPLQSDSAGPLDIVLLRNGYLPLLMDKWSEEEVRRAKVLVTTAPARRYGKGERRVLEDFVRDGGLLLFNCGWEQKGAAAKGLLEEFGFDILRAPLGPYPVQRLEDNLPGQAQFINAWPVVVTPPDLQADFESARHRYHPPLLDRPQSQRLSQLLNPLVGGGDRPGPASLETEGPDGAWVRAARTNRVEVLFQTAEGVPLAVGRRLGKGTVVVIGDTLFLGNDNLENLQYYRKGNLLFLKYLFERMQKAPR
jgi:hypothetical protein